MVTKINKPVLKIKYVAYDPTADIEGAPSSPSFFTVLDLEREVDGHTRKNDFENVKRFVNYGADINGSIDRRAPAFYAIDNLNDKIAEYLLRFMSYPCLNRLDTGLDMTLLMFAIYKKHYKAIEVLMDLNVNLSRADSKGRDAIWFALKSRDDEIIRIMKIEHDCCTIL